VVTPGPTRQPQVKATHKPQPEHPANQQTILPETQFKPALKATEHQIPTPTTTHNRGPYR
jgi:hypothetical protein